MRIAIIALGSRGDIEPYLTLAKGLIHTGHAVRLLTHPNFESYVNSTGVEFWPVGGSVQDIVQSDDMRLRLERGNFLVILAQMAQEAQARALALAQVGLSACQEMDLLIAGIGGMFIAIALAEKLHLPMLQAYYIPFTPTRAYPSFLSPGLPDWLGAGLNRPSYQLARQMIWQGFRSADRLARRDVLGLPPAPFWGPFNSPCLQDLPILYAYSPSVIPKPPRLG